MDFIHGRGKAGEGGISRVEVHLSVRAEGLMVSLRHEEDVDAEMGLRLLY